MSQNKLIFAGIITIAILIVSTLAIVEWFGPPRTIALELSGTPGTEIVGEAEVDGKPAPFSAKLPGKVTFSGIRMTFAFLPRDVQGAEFTTRVTVDGNFLMEAKIGPSVPGIAGQVYQPRLLRGMRGTYFIAGMTEESAMEWRRLKREQGGGLK